MRGKKAFCLLLAICLLLGGCASTTADAARMALTLPAFNALVGADGSQTGSGGSPYIAPPFADASYHGELAAYPGDVQMDLTALEDGYLGVSARSDKRLKFQVMKGDLTYTYDLANNGTPAIFPLQCGDGEYRLRVMENIVDSKYAELYAIYVSAVLSDENAPFLRPSAYVNYSRNSDCVKKAQELAQTAGTPLGLVSRVYEYVCKSVRYDTQLAQTVKSGYLPVPDNTMKTGKGICFDYAALSAAMLRSQGVPTKMVFGYVAPDNLYHAWNMFYTEETGWVTAKFEVTGDSWVRLDLTFAANGANDQFIGDGSNYSDIYYY